MLSLPPSASRVVQDHAGLCRVSMTVTCPTGSLDLTATRASAMWQKTPRPGAGWQDRAAAIEGLTDQERDDGLIFMDIIGAFYLVAHADYVRTVRLVPKGPESTDLVIDWMLPANLGDVCADTIERIKALPMLVIEQDGAACELNQQGSVQPSTRDTVRQEYVDLRVAA